MKILDTLQRYIGGAIILIGLCILFGIKRHQELPNLCTMIMIMRRG